MCVHNNIYWLAIMDLLDTGGGNNVLQRWGGAVVLHMKSLHWDIGWLAQKYWGHLWPAPAPPPPAATQSAAAPKATSQRGHDPTEDLKFWKSSPSSLFPLSAPAPVPFPCSFKIYNPPKNKIYFLDWVTSAECKYYNRMPDIVCSW